MHQISSHKMYERISYMEENNSEVRRCTCRKISNMEEKAAYMASETRRAAPLHENGNGKDEDGGILVSFQIKGEVKT